MLHFPATLKQIRTDEGLKKSYLTQYQDRILPRDLLNIVIDYIGFDTGVIKCKTCDFEINRNLKAYKAYFGNKEEVNANYLCITCYNQYLSYGGKIVKIAMLYNDIIQDARYFWKNIDTKEIERYVNYEKSLCFKKYSNLNSLSFSV